MCVIETHFSFRFTQPQLSKMLINTKLFYLQYSLLLKWSSTFQLGKAGLIDLDEMFVLLKGIAEKRSPDV
jgi:hypothetical protein